MTAQETKEGEGWTKELAVRAVEATDGEIVDVEDKKNRVDVTVSFSLENMHFDSVFSFPGVRVLLMRRSYPVKAFRIEKWLHRLFNEPDLEVVFVFDKQAEGYPSDIVDALERKKEQPRVDTISI